MPTALLLMRTADVLAQSLNDRGKLSSRARRRNLGCKVFFRQLSHFQGLLPRGRSSGEMNFPISFGSFFNNLNAKSAWSERTQISILPMPPSPPCGIPAAVRISSARCHEGASEKLNNAIDTNGFSDFSSDILKLIMLPIVQELENEENKAS